MEIAIIKLFDFFACTVSDSNIDNTDTKMM